MTTARSQHRYDHRLRELVQRTGDLSIATDRGVPRSTARGWLLTATTAVVSLDVADLTECELQQEALKLRQHVEKLAALLRLALVLLRISGFTLAGERLPNGQDKRRILRAVDQARACMPLRALLRLLHLSPSRFHAWRHTVCALDDQSSCPQKESLFGLIEAYGNGPYPGPPLDMLLEMFIDPDLTRMVTERVSGWVDSGLFDGVDSVRRAESPVLFYGFVNALLQRTLRSEVPTFLRHAHERIRKLFRSAKPGALVSVLNWIADAERLPLADRRFVREAYLAGVVSSEFEQAEHSTIIRSLADLLVRSVTSEEEVNIEVRQEVRLQLLRYHFPDKFVA